MVVPAAGTPERLIRTDTETFRLDNARYTFERGADGFEPRTYSVDTEERPPMAEIAEYASRKVA